MKTPGRARFARIVSTCAIILIPAAATAQEILNRIVAIVENEAITELELRQNIARTQRMLAQQKREIPDGRTLARQVLQQMVVQQLQLQEAKKRNVVIDEITLDRAIETIAKRQNLSLSDFERSFENSAESYSGFRQNVRDQLTIQKLIQNQVINQIKFSEQEIEDELAANEAGQPTTEQHRFAQIRIDPKSSGATVVAKQRLLTIRKKLQGKSVSSFGELQRHFSRLWKAAEAKDGATDLTYRLKDLGWRYTQELPAVLRRRIDSLQRNNVSPMISGKNRLYLFQRLESRGGQTIMQRQYQVRHILIPVDLIDDDDTVRRRLTAIKRRLENGADFAKLACAYSHDPLSSTRGGSLGWTNLQGLEPGFAEAAIRAYDTGTIVGPFKTTYGWHILEVTDGRERNVADDTLRQQAIAKIKQGKSEENIRVWLLGLREKSHVEIRI